MTKERFNELVDQIIEKSGKTLKEKNAKYAPANDALHNFHYGAQLDNSTTAQTIWHYMKKHMVALLDKIENDSWEDIDDAEEKIQDCINYLIFMFAAAHESYDAKMEEKANACAPNNPVHDGCIGCEYEDLPIDLETGMCMEEPCKSCSGNFCIDSEEWLNAPDNYTRG